MSCINFVIYKDIKLATYIHCYVYNLLWINFVIINFVTYKNLLCINFPITNFVTEPIGGWEQVRTRTSDSEKY